MVVIQLLAVKHPAREPKVVVEVQYPVDVLRDNDGRGRSCLAARSRETSQDVRENIAKGGLCKRPGREEPLLAHLLSSERNELSKYVDWDTVSEVVEPEK